MDVVIADAWEMVNNIAQGLARQLPGVQFDLKPESVPLGQAPHFLATPIKPISILPRTRLRGLCSLAIIEARNVEKHQVTLNILEALGRGGHWFHRGFLNGKSTGSFARLTQWRWLWCYRGTFPAEVLPRSTSEKSQYSLYVGTFKSITSDWKTCRKNIKLSLTLFTISLRDFPCMADLLVPSFLVQAQFTDELLELLRNVFRGMIDNALERISDVHLS